MDDNISRRGFLLEGLAGIVSGFAISLVPAFLSNLFAGEEYRYLKINDTSGRYAFQYLDIKSLHASNLEGKVAVLNLWSMVCPPCVQELPYLQKVVNELDSDVRFYAIVSSDSIDDYVKLDKNRENKEIQELYKHGKYLEIAKRHIVEQLLKSGITNPTLQNYVIIDESLIKQFGLGAIEFYPQTHVLEPAVLRGGTKEQGYKSAYKTGRLGPESARELISYANQRNQKLNQLTDQN